MRVSIREDLAPLADDFYLDAEPSEMKLASGRHLVSRACATLSQGVTSLDVLKALRAGKDLKTLTAAEIMAKDRQAIDASTPIERAVQMMEEKRLLNLPVEENGVVTKTVTRHDLLRAWLGQDLGVDF